MRTTAIYSLSLLLACGASKETTATPGTPDVGNPPTESAPTDGAVDEPVADAGAAADCVASELVLMTQTRAPLREGALPTQQLAVYDNGYWERTGIPDAKSGCLSPPDLADLTAALAQAEIAAPPLGPGMARCMAMPSSEVTFQAGEQSASWQAPCGASNPSDSLGELLNKLVALTSP